ncbi:MAG: TetR/AcrR family transcriptional regulator [Anaerolineae bacterium]
MADTPQAKNLTPKQRRQRNRDAVISAILQAARDIMREEGVAALNLHEIARRVGMKTPSLYEYFPNKMAIYDRLFKLGTQLFRERLARAEAQYPEPNPEQAQAILTAFMQCAIENPDLFKLVYERHVPGFVPSPDSMSESNASLDEGRERVERSVGQADTGLEIDQTRDIFIALMHGLTALHLANSPELPIGQGRFGSLIPAVVEMLRKAWGF